MPKPNETVDALNKRFDGQVVIPASKVKRIPRVETGLLSLDIATKGGIPMGVPVMLSGRKSSGKSAWSYMLLGKAAEQYGGFPLIIQSEPGFDWEWAAICGLRRSGCLFFDGAQYPIKDNLQFVLDVLRNEKPTAVLMDSLSAISGDPKQSLVDGTSRGEKAKPINEFFRKLTSAMDKEKPPLMVFIEHLHPDMNSQYPRLITTGGETKGYMAVIELRFRVESVIKEIMDDVVTYDGKKPEWTVQRRIVWELQKSKIGADGAVGTFQLGLRKTEFCYPGEITDWEELLQRAIMLKQIKKSGAWYIFGEAKFHGLQNLKSGVSAEALREILSKPRETDGEEECKEDGGKGGAGIGKQKGKARRRGGGKSSADAVPSGGEDDDEQEHVLEDGVAAEDQEGSSVGGEDSPDET